MEKLKEEFPLSEDLHRCLVMYSELDINPDTDNLTELLYSAEVLLSSNFKLTTSSFLKLSTYICIQEHRIVFDILHIEILHKKVKNNIIYSELSKKN